MRLFLPVGNPTYGLGLEFFLPLAVPSLNHTLLFNLAIHHSSTISLSLLHFVFLLSQFIPYFHCICACVVWKNPFYSLLLLVGVPIAHAPPYRPTCKLVQNRLQRRTYMLGKKASTRAVWYSAIGHVCAISRKSESFACQIYLFITNLWAHVYSPSCGFQKGVASDFPALVRTCCHGGWKIT